MINFGEGQYVSYLTVGRQVITGVLDTGSYELVVFGANCRSCGVAAHYNSHLSSTYRQGNLMTQQNFGSGGALSVSAMEQVTIGPFPTVEQAFWNVQQAQMSVLLSAAFEAVVGVGPPETPMADAWEAAQAAVANVTAFYDRGVEAPDNITNQAEMRIKVANEITKHGPLLHTLNCSTFSICIGARPDSDGVFVWNDTLAFEHPELFSRVTVVGNHTWSTNLTDAFFDYPRGMGPPDGQDSSANLGCAGGCSALLDSGTSLLAVPRTVMKAVEVAMTRLDSDCSNIDVLPDLVFKLGGSSFRLPPETYVAKVVGDLPRYLQERAPHIRATTGQQGERACQMMLMESSAVAASGPVWILGLPFFRRYYTTFNVGASRADRALFIAPHGEDDSCTPTSESEANFRFPSHQLRFISAERVRFPLTEQVASAAATVRL